ncbi:cyclic pyranopterin monophosphate synthase MoaC [Tistrella mobilis]|uniref:cyclic pyranopterin monophosphate synthase MoaC n=1 Tax=Tistrella mobilis TaxID=171437 RepID=UPI000C0B736E|nr:cyclic pyranopterin monophosphate synthase MoaC [uncultured Tistrella sp.]MAM75614.1 cyclic pyranopterin monophosphate synthase MoaC [Tistrella sp.]
MTSGLTHFDESGAAVMVDVSAKDVTKRVAVAEARVRMAPETLAVVKRGDAKKGDVIAIARLAGIMGAKRTADLIPLCHPLPLQSVTLDLEADDALPGLVIRATAKVTARTGVEMEALTAASVASLTVYDMLKAIDRGMTIETIRLIEKRGGRSGHWQAATPDDAG